MDNGKGRKAARRQDAQIAITPMVRSLRVTNTWSVASPAVHLCGNGRVFAILTSSYVSLPGFPSQTLQNPCRRRRGVDEGEDRAWPFHLEESTEFRERSAVPVWLCSVFPIRFGFEKLWTMANGNPSTV